MSLYSRIEECIVDIDTLAVLKGFKREIDSADEDSDWLLFLENAGVDNWSGYEYAQELRAAQYALDEETT
jgi:hypothetical protein